MSAIDDLLGEIEAKEAEARESIREAELRLGIEAASRHESLGLRVGAKLLESVLAASDAVNQAEKDNLAARSFLEEYNQDEERLGSMLQDEKDRADEIRSLSIRLGAMIYEQCSFSLLDKEAYKAVYDDVEADRRLEQSSGSSMFSRILGSGKAMVRKMGEESRFVSYAGIALDSCSPVNGENASGILAEIIKLNKCQEDEEKEKNTLQARISSTREKAKQLERSADAEARRIAGLRKAEEEALVSYGSYLYDKGSEWIAEDTPSCILDVLELLLNLYSGYDSIIAEKERLEREAEADDYRAMIESEEGKIMVLEKEKERIDKEIVEIREEIERLRNKITRLGI